MLVRSQQAWETIAGASGRLVGIAAYNTEASSSRSGRVRPQVERAIRIKSQNRRQENRQESNEKSYRPYKAKQREEPHYHRRIDDRRSHSSSDSRQLFTSGTDREKKETFPNKLPPRTTTRVYPSSRPNRSPDQSNVYGNIRELRFQAAQKLNILIREDRSRPQEAFNEGQEIFDSLSSFAKREVRIYTAMIRLATRAGKYQWALSAFNEMKKNGVAPDAHTYRSIFEGLVMSAESLSADSKVVQRVHEIFDEFESIWRRLYPTPSRRKYGHQEKEYEEMTGETSTARSYAASIKSMEKGLMETPAAFDVACLFYFAFLFSVKAYDQASTLLERVDELASPPSRLTPSRLPFMLSSRYLYELLQANVDVQVNRRDTVLRAYKTVMTALQEGGNVFADHFSTSFNAKQGRDSKLERREMDRSLHPALSILVKYDVPDRHSIIRQSLQDLYSRPQLASLPPITIEKTLRVAMDNITGDPALVIRIFESALDYNDGVADRFDDRDLSRTQVKVNLRDVMECWTKAWFVAIQELKDLTKAMDLMQRAVTMRKSTSSSRLSPPSMAKTFTFSHLMRLSQEKQDWNMAVQVWKLFFQEVEGNDRLLDMPSLHHLIFYFFTLAYKLDKDASGQQDKVIRYTRTALELLEKDFGLENPALFGKIESIFKENSNVKVGPEGQKENSNYAFCLEYVSAIRLTCRMALDTGEQGVDLMEKHQVEKWKNLRKKAAQLRDLGSGTNVDEAEADWLRSGVKGKSSLALSDNDMRELLG